MAVIGPDASLFEAMHNPDSQPNPSITLHRSTDRRGSLHCKVQEQATIYLPLPKYEFPDASFQMKDMPKPILMKKYLRKLNIGAYENVETAL